MNNLIIILYINSLNNVKKSNLSSKKRILYKQIK